MNFNEWSGKKCPLRYRCNKIRYGWEWYVGDGQCKRISDMKTIDIQRALEDGRTWWGAIPNIPFHELMPKHRGYLFLKDTLIYELQFRGIDCSNV